jgi:beta-glucosidase
MIAVGVLDRPPCPDCVHFRNVTSPEHNNVARVAARAGMVLVQNRNGVLPLSPHIVKKLVVVGLAAHTRVVRMTIGSGQVDGQRLVTPLQGLLAQAPASTEILYLPSVGTASEAEQLREADAAVVFVGTTAGEGHDRDNLTLCSGPCTEPSACPAPLAPDQPGGCGQDDLVAAVAALQPRTAVVVSTPGAILLPWKDKVASIIVAWLPGQEFGSAIADILYGATNPTGRLPVTLPNVENEMNMTRLQYPGVGNRSVHGDGAYTNYTEKLEVGYRWYSARGVRPAFAFGHGLSYSVFGYTDMAVTGRNISFRVTNRGNCSGADIPQAYLTFPPGHGRTLSATATSSTRAEPESDEPPHQLRWFQKTKLLATGESEQLHFSLSDRDVSVWDASHHSWRIVRGQFTVSVGASSVDTRLEDTVYV